MTGVNSCAKIPYGMAIKKFAIIVRIVNLPTSAAEDVASIAHLSLLTCSQPGTPQMANG